jgi:glycosyltransferase involved in cell wall biosynthesis
MSASAVPVSIVLPAYNAQRFLAQALDSVLAQTHTQFELILVDDGSTDGTLAIAREYERRDPRVRAVTQPNGRIARALNRGIELAQHEWIARMDADDVMEPNRLERQLAFVDANPDLAVASSLVLYIDDNDRVIGRGRSPFTDRRTVARYIKRNRVVAFNHPAALIRKSVLLEVGGYRPEFVPAEDCDLWNRIIERGHPVLVQPEYLLRYRIYGQSTVGQNVVATDQRLEWVRQCMILRRQGKPELSFDEFRQRLESAPWWSRLNRWRSARGAALYGRAVFCISAGNYLRGGASLAAAAPLRPGLIFERVGPRIASAFSRLLGRSA